MSPIIVWITAALGALVVGVATSSLFDELLNRVVLLRPRRWSRGVILRSVVTVIITVGVMALWAWVWIRYIAG